MVLCVYVFCYFLSEYPTAAPPATYTQNGVHGLQSLALKAV
jgi:hypothetical protein